MIDEDFDLQYEMQEGLIIQDAYRRVGYDLFQYGKRIAYASNWKDAIKAAMLYMNKSHYWPNVFYVNERGNVDLLVISRRGRGYTSKILESWV